MGDSKISLLCLTGEPREMGRTHGLAARSAGALGAIGYFCGFLDRLFALETGGTADRWMRAAGRELLGAGLESSFAERIPLRYRESIRGFAEGSGLPEADLVRGFVMPDVCAYLQGLRFGILGGMACTSVLALTADAEPRLLHARNLDYAGGEVWASAPALVEYRPSDGQAYASVTSLGIDTAGITACNESGLSLSLHMNYSRRVCSRGTPVLFLGHEVMRRARMLAEAVAILREFPRGGGWTFVIGSGRERTGAAVQFDAERFSVVPLREGRLCVTNHYLRPETAAAEYWVSPGRRIDSLDRLARAERLTADGASRTPEAAARLLADVIDPTSGRERSFASTIAQVHTASTALFLPADGTAFVGQGPPPTSRGPLHGFSFFPGPHPSGVRLEGTTPSPLDPARRHYALAHEAYFPGGDLEGAARELSRAVEAAPADPLIRLMAGLVALKRDRRAEATAHLAEAARGADTPYRVAQAKLYLARALDVLGRREEALSVYGEIANDPVFGGAARKGKRRPWHRGDRPRWILDFTVGDVVEA